jgi:hypothetical protein
MNAGRDVERLIADWLAEEAAVRSPDRVLVEARRTVLTTGQRRLAARWREPVYLSPFRLATMAAALVVAVVGGAWVGRATAPGGVGGAVTTPAPTESTAPAGLSLEAYRSAHNALCQTYAAQLAPLNAKLKRIYDPTLPAADRAIEVQALINIVALTEAFADEIGKLQPPPSIAVDQTVYVSNYQHIAALIRLEFPLIERGDYAGAEALDQATGGFREIGEFEQSNGLTACP